MDELKAAIRAVSGLKCVGECERVLINCRDHCSFYTECSVISDFFAQLEEYESDADKVLDGLSELEAPEDKRALIVSYGILCGMRRGS